MTPNEAIGFKLQLRAILGLFFRRFEFKNSVMIATDVWAVVEAA
jgi:hypothetical protein